MEKPQTFRLFRKMPSFLGGLASLIDLSPNKSRYNYDISADKADMNSLRADWFAIGNDLRKAIEKYEREQQSVRTTK